MSFSIQRHGFTTPVALFRSIAQDLLDGGMRLVNSDSTALDITIQLPSVKVAFDGVDQPRLGVGGEANWTIGYPTSAAQQNSCGLVSFASTNIPPVETKLITADFDFVMTPELAVGVPLVGTPKGINNVFTTTDSSLSILLPFSVQIDHTVLDTSDYTVAYDLVKRALVTVTNLDKIPASSSLVTANYTMALPSQRSLQNVSLSNSVILPSKSFDLATCKLTLTEIVSQVISASTALISEYTYEAPSSMSLQFPVQRRAPWGFGQSAPIYQKTISLPVPESVTLNAGGTERTYVYDMTNAFDGVDSTFLNIALYNYPVGTPKTGLTKTLFDYGMSHSFGTAGVASYVPPVGDLYSNYINYINVVTINMYSQYQTTKLGATLTGDKSGYNPTFYTPTSHVIIEDPSTVVINHTNADGSPILMPDGITPKVLVNGVDYNVSSPLPNGTVKVDFVPESVPTTGTILTTSFTYRPLTPDTKIVGAILQGTIDGTNFEFTINDRLGGTKWILENTAVMDPLFESQPWRIHIDAGYTLEFNNQVDYPQGSSNKHQEFIKEYGRIVVGTSYQLLDDGTVRMYPKLVDAPYEDAYKKLYETNLGEFMAVDHSPYSTSMPYEIFTDDFNATSGPRFDHLGTEGSISIGEISPLISELELNACAPNGYQISITDHGLVFSINNESHPVGNGGRFVAIQRLVDAVTGEVLLDRKSPVFCIFNQIERNYIDYVGTTSQSLDLFKRGLSKIYQIVVRESDVWAPSVPKEIQEFSEYVGGVFNTQRQISIAEDGSYIITIPDGLTTSRHLWHNKRPDLIGFCDASVIVRDNQAKVNMYNQKDTLGNPVMRTFNAQSCTRGEHEGMRLLIWTSGGGI